VVEDNPVNQGLMRHLLEGWRLAYDLAGDGAEAINYLRANTYDLVLLDIQMPRLDGYTTSRYVRDELKLTVPIVAMTAYAMPGEREKCLRAGMNDYLAKPVREGELYRLIARFVPLPAGLPAPGPSPAPEDSPYQCISLGYLHQVSRGNKGYEKTVTGEFMETVPTELRDLADAFAAGDFKTLRQVAHSLKTSVSIMGLTDRLAADLDALEEAAPGDPRVPQTIETVTAVCREALREAGRLYASL
jgi:CheY-like chemotaxis protein